MNSDLRNALVALGVAFVGGIGFTLFTPSATTDRDFLVDAGLRDSQRVAVVCTERLGRGVAKRLLREQPDSLRPHQRYAQVARTGFCMRDEGAGNCLRPDGGVLPAVQSGSIVIPSLRRIARFEEAEDENDDGAASASYPLPQHCAVKPCADFPGLCQQAFGVRVTTPSCVIPDCWRSDGGWDDSAIVNCRQRLEDGGARYGGCNVFQAEKAVGGRCVPTVCTVVSGESGEWL